MDKQKFQRWLDRQIYDLSRETQTPNHEIARRIYLLISSQIAEGKFDE